MLTWHEYDDVLDDVDPGRVEEHFFETAKGYIVLDVHSLTDAEVDELAAELQTFLRWRFPDVELTILR